MIGTVRWGQGPVDFELQTNDEAVLHHARGVFGPWPGSDARRVAGRWRILARGGSFSVGTESQGVDEPAAKLEATAEAAVCTVEFAAIGKLLECEEEVLCIHSALLSWNGRGIAIVGPALAGKTTLACALWQSGWSFHCDDATMIVNGLAYPTPRRVSLREGSRSLVGEALWNRSMATPSFATTPKGCLFHPHEVAKANKPPPLTELDAIIFLARRGSPARGPARRVPPAETALGLFQYTNLKKRLSFSKALDRVAGVAESVPGYDVPRAGLRDMIAEVENLVGVPNAR